MGNSKKVGDILKGNEINNNYISMILKNPDAYINDYKNTVLKVANSNAKYKGKPVPFLYNPMFFSESEEESLKSIMEKMMKIGDKVTDQFIKDESYRKLFGFPKFIEEMILRENRYSINVPIARFDLFFKDDKNFKFCELNTDGSSAMNEDNTIGRILMESKAIQDMSTNYSLYNRELIDKWVMESLSIFRKWDPKNNNPNVAIVDFVESGTSAEFLEFKKAYEKQGYNCIIVDPRELEYRQGNLYKDEYRIDLVYRRIVTFELIEKADEVQNFINAYMDDAMCVIGTIRSQVIHNKVFFKILFDEQTHRFLEEDEIKFINDHIPFTGLFKGSRNVFEEVLNNKDKYIMKPVDMNASQGVFVGRDLSLSDWKERLYKIFDTDYLYQEFITPYQRDFIIFNGSGFEIQKFKSIVGVFLYKRKYAGLYTRIGKENIISGVTNYFTVPNLIVEKK